MKDTFKLIYDGQLSTPTDTDKELLAKISHFEDSCGQRFGEKATEILEFLDEILDCCGKINEERFVAGLKVGLSMSQECQEYFEKAKIKK